MINQFEYLNKEDKIKKIKTWSNRLNEQPTVFPNIYNVSIIRFIEMPDDFYGDTVNVMIKYNIVFDDNKKLGYLSVDKDFKKYQEDIFSEEFVVELIESDEKELINKIDVNFSELFNILTA
ncbi:hypothetical protein [Sutterella wadsworthensis]|uniref:hypothetical protein n=1 Tax=Sutterella wadsworthensis TaxID=40545 RepID=UPI0032C0D650